MARVRMHPGNVLREELRARDMSANQLALAIRVPANRVTAILRGDRAVSAETALRLGRYFGTGPEFWMNLQSRYDVSVAVSERGQLIEQEVQVASVGNTPAPRTNRQTPRPSSVVNRRACRAPRA